MSDHKWGIFWMSFYGWNAAGFAWDAATGRTGLAIAALVAAIVCAYLAIDHLSRQHKPHFASGKRGK